MRVAAVDIGTNSTRLLIADVFEGGLSTVVRTTAITRLGEGVDSYRLIADSAMKRTRAVIEDYAEKIRSSKAKRVGVIATSACRDARNRDEFFDQVSASLGVRPELLSGEAEAHLSFAGALCGWPEAGTGPLLVVDIGGGSTELSVGAIKDSATAVSTMRLPSRSSGTHAAGLSSAPSHDDVGELSTAPSSRELSELLGISLMGWASLDIGCVRVTERFLHSDPPNPEELSEALREVDSHLVSIESRVPVRKATTLVGLAGTVTTLAALDLRLDAYDPEAVHHHCIERESVEELFRYVATSPKELLRKEPGIDPKRADVIVGGTVVLVAMLRRWEFPKVIVSEEDILDGVALATSAGLLGSDAA